MKFFLSFLLVFCTSFLGVAAEEAQLKSGEHNNFTRLVFYLPSPRDWSVVRDDSSNSIQVTFDGPEFSIDLSSVFRRIGRNRVQSVEKTSNGLRINLACNCDYSTFAPKPGMYALDISEARSNSKTADQSSMEVQELQRYNGNGSVEPKLTVSGQTLSIVGLGVDQRVERMVIDTLGLPPPSVRFYDSIEKELFSEPNSTQGDAASESRPSGDICHPDYYFEPTDWQLSNDLQSAIPSLLQNLFADSGVVDQEIAETLGKHYLSFGLGLEAISFFELSSSKEAIVLTDVAKVVEQLSQDKSKLSQYQCGTGEDFWTAISLGFTSSTDAKSKSANVIEYYLNLPTELQLNLSERFAQAFALVSANKISESLLPGYTRRSLMSAETATLMSLNSEDVSPSNRVKEMQKVIQSDNRKAPLALLEMFSSIQMADKSTPEDRALLRSFSKELRESTQYDKWWATELHLAVADRDQTSVFSLLANAPPKMGSEIDRVLSDIFEFISSEYEDIKFLKFALALDEGALAKIPENNMALMNERMISLGFDGFL